MKPIRKDVAVTEKEAKRIERRPNALAVVALIASAAVLVLAVIVMIGAS